MADTNDLRTGPPAGPLAGLPQFQDVVATAAGSTGQVFRARQPATDRWVAVKVFGPGRTPAGNGRVTPDPAVRHRFERELAITGRLSGHPYLIMILEHGVTPSGHPFLVMPWYGRGTLADELARCGPMTVPDVLTLGVRIAAGLDHSHGHGVTHRDVKPSNILLSERGEPVLADFGGSADHRPRAGQEGDAATFTPGHASPEMLRDEATGAPSDVWSLCSTLYTALTGTRPFAGGRHAGDRSGGLPGELARTLDEPMPPIDRTDVPRALSDQLAAGLAKRAGDRPSALELATALQGIQAGAGLPVTEIPGRPHGRPTPPPAPVSSARPDPDPPTVIRAAPAAPQPRRGAGSTAAIGALASVAVVAGAVIVAAQVQAPRLAARPLATTPQAAMQGHLTGTSRAAGLQVTRRGATTIDLAWQDTNAGGARYLVVVDPDPRAAGPVPADRLTGHTAGGLRPRTSYCFRIITGDTEVAAVTAPVCTTTR